MNVVCTRRAWRDGVVDGPGGHHWDPELVGGDVGQVVVRAGRLDVSGAAVARSLHEWTPLGRRRPLNAVQRGISKGPSDFVVEMARRLAPADTEH
jgi:hypothetical protein